MSRNATHATLLVSDAKREESGVYEISLKNSSGAVSYKIKVDVLGEW